MSIFGPKLKLRKIIDKHQDSILGIISPESKKDDTPPPPSSDGNLTHDVALDVSADAFEKLLYGFIRNIYATISHQSSNNISDDIIRLCLTFYNTGFENLKFDLYNTKYCDVLYNVILKGSMKADHISCHRVFCTSIGYNMGVHKWKIKYIENDKKSLSSPYGGIGIVSENKILKKDNKFGNYAQQNHKALNWINNRSFGNVYYFDQGSQCVYHYMYGKGKVLHSKKKMKEKNCSYKKGDVMTIILDCNRWKLKILKNDQNILMNDEEITIKKKYITYYPVLAFYHHGDTYNIIRK